jgi:Fe-S-cluster-containing dehydrogenase component
LRAIGFVDLLRIPDKVIQKSVLPALAQVTDSPLSISGVSIIGGDRSSSQEENDTPSGFVEFLVERRFVNGSRGMMIDLFRCARCDDCVRACAAAHDGNPRFVRTGARHRGVMIAHSCMHCHDPICLIGCPSGSIQRAGDDLTVVINDDTCIGCATCADSCPYKNIIMVEIADRTGKPLFDDKSGAPILKATKCDYCIDQLTGPACRYACPHDALHRVNFKSMEEAP